MCKWYLCTPCNLGFLTDIPCRCYWAPKDRNPQSKISRLTKSCRKHIQKYIMCIRRLHYKNRQIRKKDNNSKCCKSGMDMDIGCKFQRLNIFRRRNFYSILLHCKQYIQWSISCTWHSRQMIKDSIQLSNQCSWYSTDICSSWSDKRSRLLSSDSIPLHKWCSNLYSHI